MATRPRSRSIFYINLDDSQGNKLCDKLIKHASLLSAKANSTTRKGQSFAFEDRAKDMYDKADREIRTVKLVDSTTEGWVYVTRNYIKKEIISKRNLARAKALTRFQTKQTLCDEKEVSTGGSSRKDNEMLIMQTKVLGQHLLRANTERREFGRSDKIDSCTVEGRRKWRANTESIVMELPLFDYKFPVNKNDLKTQAKTKEMKKACRNNALFAKILEAKTEIKTQKSDFDPDQEEYVEMSLNNKPLEKDGSEPQNSNNKVVERHQGFLDEGSPQYYNSGVSGGTDSKREKEKSLDTSNENQEPVVIKSSPIKKYVDHSFRPSPVPRKQSIKPQPKPRTKMSVLRREHESGENADPVALKTPHSPGTSENEKNEPNENSCHSSLNNMKPTPSPRPKTTMARASVPASFSAFVRSSNDRLSSSCLDVRPDSKRKNLLSDCQNTLPASPPPRPPKTRLIKNQTSFDPSKMTFKPNHTLRNSGLKDENGYLLPVDEHLLPEKANKRFVCQRSPPPLPHKPTIKNLGNSTMSPSTGSKAKTFAPGGNLSLKVHLPTEPSTIPRASPSFLRSEEITSGLKKTQYEMKLAQGPWYACRDITRESFIDDIPIWPYEYVEEWVPPLKTSKHTSDNLTTSKGDPLKTQREPTFSEMTLTEQKSDGSPTRTDAYEVMDLPPLVFTKANERACIQNTEQYEEVKSNSGSDRKKFPLYYEDIDLSIVTERNNRTDDYEEVYSP